MLRVLIAVLVLAILGVVAVVAAGAAEPLTLLTLVPLGLFLVLALVFRRVFGGIDEDGKRAAELATVGLRRVGVVRDAVPYAAAHGGAVFQPEGAQMVLRVELRADEHGVGESVAVHVVEDSERARARIGTEVVVRVHPDASYLRALEGFLPNGQPDRG